jgi:Protein of unknown function (DUF664)
MTWKAPEAARSNTLFVADEPGMLDTWLEFHRQTLLQKCAGLTGEQLATRSLAPSQLSLLGLVRHMSEVERAWFRGRVAGESVPMLYCSDERPDGDFDDADPAAAEVDFATYHREVEQACAAVAGRSLEDVFVHPRIQVEMSVRWVYVHMIEEYARHNGHADLLREQVDGLVGE